MASKSVRSAAYDLFRAAGESLRFYRRRAKRYLRPYDFLEFFLFLMAAGLAINALSVSNVLTAIFGTFYVFGLILKFAFQAKDRMANDIVHAEVLWGLFDLLSKTQFGNDPYIRFTLFKEDPLDDEFIIPWYRYEHGCRNPIKAAEKSMARYKKGEGCTGVAWSGGNNSVQIKALPAQFQSRDKFEEYYRDTLKIDADTVTQLSEYMQGVGILLSCGLFDTRGKFLGVVSIDLQWRWVSYEPPVFAAADGHERTLNGTNFVAIAHLCQSTLRSLEQSQR